MSSFSLPFLARVAQCARAVLQRPPPKPNARPPVRPLACPADKMMSSRPSKPRRQWWCGGVGTTMRRQCPQVCPASCKLPGVLHAVFHEFINHNGSKWHEEVSWRQKRSLWTDGGR